MRTITSGIYRIIHKSSSKQYIGSSIDIEVRWRKHVYDLNRQKHSNTHLLNAWNKYGQDDFVLEIVEICEPLKEILLEREQYHIDTLRPEFNICKKAGSRLGSKASAETKAKMSQSMVGKNVGKTRTQEMIDSMRDRVSNPSDETRAKMAAAKIGTIVSEQTKAKMSASHKGYVPAETSIAKTVQTRHERRLANIADLETTPKESLKKNDVRHMLRRFDTETILSIRSSTETDLKLSVVYQCSPTTISRIRRNLIYKDV